MRLGEALYVALVVHVACPYQNIATRAEFKFVCLLALTLGNAAVLFFQFVDKHVPEIVELWLGGFDAQSLRRGAESDALEDAVVQFIPDLGVRAMVEDGPDALDELLVPVCLMERDELDLPTCLVLAEERREAPLA